MSGTNSKIILRLYYIMHRLTVTQVLFSLFIENVSFVYVRQLILGPALHFEATGTSILDFRHVRLLEWSFCIGESNLPYSL